MLMDIILYLIQIIQDLYQQNCWLINFICRYIPLKQWAFDDSHSPKYQKFKIDQLPLITDFRQDWTYKDLIPYFEKRYGKTVTPIRRHSGCDISDDCCCPRCGAPKIYLYKNNGSKGQLLCKVCDARFSQDVSRYSSVKLRCPHCGNALVPKKDRKFFIVHKCVNKNCPYYLHQLKKVDKEDLKDPHGKNKYKLHYIYREFTVDFFRMDLNSLPKNASSLKFSKFDAHTMSLCLTLHVNLGLSLRKTSQALKDLYNISISHQQIANYCKTAAICIKPFVDNYHYKPSNTFAAYETYIKIRGVKAYIWFIMDAASRSILGYQVSDNRSVGPCILTMRMAFRQFTELPKNFRFIADGYSAYPLAALQFAQEFGDDGMNPLRVLIYSVPAIISLMGLKYIKAVNDPVINFSVNTSTVTAAIAIVAMGTSGIFIGRLPIYVNIYANCILLPWEIENTFADHIARIVKFGAMFCYLVFFYYQMHFAWGFI